VRVFLYELATCGGFDVEGRDASLREALLPEGRAMFAAFAEDLISIPELEVVSFSDGRYDAFVSPDNCPLAVSRVSEGLATFRELSAAADWTIIIAPEIDGHLLRLSQLAIDAGGRLLGPSPTTIALTSDKHATAEYLASRGVNVPQGVALDVGDVCPADFAYPAVLKPRDGAGSEGIVFIDNVAYPGIVTCPSRLERFCDGLACSVAALCGPTGMTTLETCRQHVHRDRNFRYDGGSLPLAPELAQRARRLAERAIATLPDALGYIGVDMVLGDDPHGTQDVVVEINPRMTTSYIGLRAATQQNLAKAMIDIAFGATMTMDIPFSRDPIHFHADGVVMAGTVQQ
jgi:predicted ATP-grasp superfamily ATP-dependent carboligase